jgi:hypothetical protein
VPAATITNIFATGADAGGGPEVRVFNRDTGAPTFSFMAYDSSFTGGVRVAVGDIAGNGTEDIVTAPGPGYAPYIRVFDGSTGALLRQFLAFNSSFMGGENIAVGDVNGDGKADIIVGADAGGGPNVKVFDGLSAVTSQTPTVLDNFFAYNPSFTGGVRVAAGDVNGDGLADIICGAGPGGGPNITVFSGLDGSLLGSFFAFPSTFTGGVNVAAGSITDSSTTDIIAGAGPGGGPEVSIFQGIDFQPVQSFFAYASSFRGGVRVSAHDPGGQTYITTTPGTGGGPQVNEFSVAVSGATTAQDLPPLTISAVSAFYAYDASFLGGVYVAGDGSAKGGDHVDYSFIRQNEGTKVDFYVPTDSNDNPVATSGITVASGVDLSTDMGYILQYLSPSSPVYQQFLNIKNSGLYKLKGAAAQQKIDDNPNLFQALPNDRAIISAVNSAAYQFYYNQTMTQFNTDVAAAGGSLVWDQLPTEFQTVLLDIDFYAGLGSLTGTIGSTVTQPSPQHVNLTMTLFWDYVVNNDWHNALLQLQSLGYFKTGDSARVTKEVNELSAGIAKIGASVAVQAWVILPITPIVSKSPSTPSTAPVTTFDGAYTGSYSGTGTLDGYTAPASGGVSLSISNGEITVSAPGDGSGTVAANGVATFTGAGGSGNFDGADYTFGGTFVVAPDGTASGSGGWQATLTGGSASGTWSVARI